MSSNKPAYLIASALYPEGHGSLQEYALAAGPIFKAYGAEPMVVGNTHQQVEAFEGDWSNSDAKISLIKFPSMQHLKDCFSSKEYKAIEHLRTDVIDTNFMVGVE